MNAIRWPGHTFEAAAIIALQLTSGCSNYQFERALLSDGKYDIQKLIADFKANQEKPLEEFSWYPLVATSENDFYHQSAAEDQTPIVGWYSKIAPWADYPAGYCLGTYRSYGPLEAYSRTRESRFDDSGAGFEVLEKKEILFRLWRQVQSFVDTRQGLRRENRHEILFGLLPVYHGISYQPVKDKLLSP